MPLFQKSVLNKFIKSQDSAKIETAYQQFSDIFLNEKRQAEIRSMKEEEYQDGFLNDLFIKILGYVIRPNDGYNLVREKKNEADSKKADGAILKNDSPLAVIELKGTDTTDLDKVTNQGFGYKNNHKECVYVVISNFEKLRFFIHHAVDYIEFNLFSLTKEEFTTLWLCLHSDNLLDNIPAKIKAESVVKEEDITKNLYKDYSSFKQELWQDIMRLNPNGDPLQFYKKTQKLIDRFLFIFFAEDAGLLPPNSISRMVDRWKTLKEEDAYKPLYEIFKQYFGYINTGRPGKTPQDEIFAYNGGLFLEDDVLDTVSISDDVLLKHVSRLTTYDFSSEVDVNILGHIFENSLNDIEAVTAELEGQEIDKSKTKRKKDGVFYTPKYITKYIVDNTVGKLCDEKKVELNIVDEEYAKGRTNRKKETLKILDENLQAYRNWLLNITICDPACGSGAFLNQALEYLMEEHRYIDELESQLLGAGFTFPGVENHILENNIFGVDINEESIEIAKLSLWLRTAQRGRKLTSLNNNIKCGNSLIDDPEVAGEKAFNWQKEFPTVFEKGGFDIVIGNPPYLRVQGIKENHNKESAFFENKYKSATGRYDLYILFIEKTTKLINQHGKVSLILPHNFITGNLGIGIRKLLSDNNLIEEILHFGSHLVFPDASTYTCILGVSNNNKVIRYASIIPEQINSPIIFEHIDYEKVLSENWQLNNSSHQALLDKLHKNKFNIAYFFSDVARGIVSGADDVFILKGQITENLFKGYSKELDKEIEIEAALVRPILMGSSVSRYQKLQNEKFIIYPHIRNNGKTEIISEDRFQTSYPLTFSYLSNFKNKLTDKKIRYKTNPSFWYSLHNSRDLNIFECKKIITPYLANNCQMTIDNCGEFVTNDKCSILILKPQYQQLYELFLGVLNSKLMWFYINKTSSEFSGGYFAFTNLFLNPFPFPEISEKNSESLIKKAKTQLLNTENHQKIKSKFLMYFSLQYHLEKLTMKLYNWDLLDFSDFIKELNKAIKAVKGTPLTKKDEFEWMELFEENKKKALELKSQIDQTDKEIDRMVYELYGLTEEEIQIVENS